MIPTWAKWLAAALILAALVTAEKMYEHHIYQTGYQTAEAVYQKREADASLKASMALSALNEQIRSLSMKLTRQLDQIAELDEKEKQNAKAHEDTLRAALRNGAIRLRVPVASCESGKAGSGNSAGTVAGIDNQASAELLPAAADDLASLAFDADAEVRRTNECIDRYEAVRKAINSAGQKADTKQDIGDHVDGDQITEKAKGA